MSRRIQNGFAIAFLVLLFLQIPALPELNAPLLAADIIFPLLIISLIPDWEKIISWFKDWRESLPLCLFIALAAISSLANLSFYNFAVFSYMAAIFVSLKICGLSVTTKFRIGAAMLFILTLAFLRSWLWRQCFATDTGMFFIDPNLPPQDHAMLGARFQFLFSNPNLLGSFYILPLLLCREWLEINVFKKISNLHRLFWAIAISLLALSPLFSSVSKHAIASLAIMGAMFSQAPILQKIRPRTLTWIAIFFFGAIALASITWITFPLTAQFPFINTSLPSNYALHRQIYEKIVIHDFRGALLGHSPAQIHELYPKYADEQAFATVLRAYNSEHLAPGYATFMDPHCEYLNLAAFFGIPATAFCLIFWLKRMRSNQRGTAIIIIAILFCLCWDDLLSKRWIWAAAAMADSQQPKDTNLH